MIKADDVKLCNCSVCNKELLGKETERKVTLGSAIEGGLKFLPIGGRIFGRPFCLECLRVRHIPSSAATPDPSPWGENAVRAMEGE